MTRVRWSDSAVRDLADMRSRFDADRPDVAQAAIDRVVPSTDFLLKHPGIGTPVGYRRWRRWRPRHTRYVLFYQPDRDGLTIVRVLHERSDWWSVVS